MRGDGLKEFLILMLDGDVEESLAGFHIDLVDVDLFILEDGDEFGGISFFCKFDEGWEFTHIREQTTKYVTNLISNDIRSNRVRHTHRRLPLPGQLLC